MTCQNSNCALARKGRAWVYDQNFNQYYFCMCCDTPFAFTDLACRAVQAKTSATQQKSLHSATDSPRPGTLGQAGTPTTARVDNGAGPCHKSILSDILAGTPQEVIDLVNKAAQIFIDKQQREVPGKDEAQRAAQKLEKRLKSATQEVKRAKLDVIAKNDELDKSITKHAEATEKLKTIKP